MNPNDTTPPPPKPGTDNQNQQLQQFWREVYLINIRQGVSNATAFIQANQAIKDFKNQFNKEDS